MPTYKATDKLSLNLRGEYLNEDGDGINYCFISYGMLMEA